METSAVYWEPQIKTYGILQRTGLHLLVGSRHLSGTANLLKSLRSHNKWARALLMVAVMPDARQKLRTCLVLDLEGRSELLNGLESPDGPHQLRVTPGVEMVCFHGPHYGDRYGIAATVFNALTSRRIPLLASACCGASVFLVIPQGIAVATCAALSQDVVVPQTEPRIR